MRKKIGRNDPCHCGALKPDGSPMKYKKCCEPKERRSIPQEVIDYYKNNLPIPEPFERGGFLTGRPFITEVFQGTRVRAVGNIVYRRPIEETFHLFILRRFSEILTQKWIESEEKKDNPHTLVRWFQETQGNVSVSNPESKNLLRGVKMSGNMRALLALAYDFYSLQHCIAPVPQKLLNRLRDENQFQGARYEIAVAGLACRAGFNIKWINDEGKHCEFIGTHKVTGDKAAFEAKSHHRGGVLGRDGVFDPESAKTKIIDHIKEALKQTKTEDMPLIVFDDLNLPLSSGVPLDEKKWFKEVEDHLEKFGFLSSSEFSRCAVLIVTNFSWHFHYDIPPDSNELVTHFHEGGTYSLKKQTVLQYLNLAAQQYGFVPVLAHEFQKSTKH
jgi:hypothetical protein